METLIPNSNSKPQNEELFQTFSSKGEPLVVKPRSIVHKAGDWHQSVNIFIFWNNHILLQKRSKTKTIMPQYWDLSAAEHLKVGESYSEAVIRGLEEELGIQVESQDITLGVSTHKNILNIPGQVFDREFVQTWIFNSVKQPKISTTDGEVEKTCWVDFSTFGSTTLPSFISLIKNAISTSFPNEKNIQFTPWFLKELELYSNLISESK